MTSPRKAQANRGNALRSTGPKSAAGKSVTAQNAKRHGLSVALPADVVSPIVNEVALLIRKDEIDEHTARELAARIVEYERNLSHERETFAALSEGTVDNDPGPVTPADSADPEERLLILTNLLAKPGLAKKDREMLKLYAGAYRVIVSIDRRRAMERATTSQRYYRRATNQLIKSLKAVR